MPLTAIQAKEAKPGAKDYKLADEKGLFLLVKKTGRKYWRMKYRYDGKEKLLAIGVYPDTSLKGARERRDEARKQLPNGVDPSAQKQRQKIIRAEVASNSFEAIAREWYAVKISDKSESHKNQTLRMLEKELFPELGKRPVTEITAPALLKLLRKIENRGVVDTAHRAKQTAGQVFQFAIQTARAERNPAKELTGALRPKEKTHYAAITTPLETGRLMLAIDAFTGTAIVKAALMMSVLTFQRPRQIRMMEWSQIKWDENRIEILGPEMKTKDPHIVPLSRQAIKVLEQIQSLTGRGAYVFPSQRGASRPMSNNTIRTALRTMGYDNQTMTAHGFKAMARTMLDELLDYRVEWIEQQIAHKVRDPNGRAYNRTKHLPQRAEMMQRWADYLDELKRQAAGDNVVTINFQ